MWAKRELYNVEWKEYLRCIKCWELKEATTDNFMKKKQNLFWLSWMCKTCEREYNSKYYKWNKEIIWERHRRYNKDNGDKIREKKKIHYSENKDVINKSIRDNREKHIKELWYDRTYFHRKANCYATKHNLKPKYCPICWEENKIELHHPSYESFDKWSDVVFCCKSCHQKIHSGIIECPKPTNLLSC